MQSLIAQCAQNLLNNKTKIILEDNYRKLSGFDLFQKSMELVTFFRDKGIKIGDKIAVQLPNSIEFVLCYFAGILGGFTIVPINSMLPSKDITYILELTKPALHLKFLNEIKYKPYSNEGYLAKNDKALMAIFFTSGTTERPKGVCHTTQNILLNALTFNKLAKLNEQTKLLHIMPMGYMAGFLNTLLCPILAGGSVVIAPQFNVKEVINFWKPAIKHGIDTLWLTPTMAALLARLNRNKDISEWTSRNLRNVFIGTAPLSRSIKDLFKKVFYIDCFESYGMTEVMLVSTNTHKQTKQDSVGCLLEGIKIEAKDEQGCSLSKEKEGSLYIKTPFAFQGYLDSHNGQMSPINNEWINTGDYGYLDSDGYLFITGRTKDLIIHGGMNVSPRAVEEVLLEYNDIHDVAVLGKPHPFWGEEIVAFIIMKEDLIFNQVDIIDYCKKNLSEDSIPSLFKIVKDFPRSSIGKIQKQKLKELL